jgi:hypothetical protein
MTRLPDFLLSATVMTGLLNFRTSGLQKIFRTSENLPAFLLSAIVMTGLLNFRTSGLQKIFRTSV